MHFLLPVLDRELIEIVVQRSSSAELVSAARLWCKQLNRLSLVVNDQTGFLVNRLLFPVFSRAIDLWLAGNSPLLIDEVALEMGLGFGPFVAMDHIGLDTVVRAGAGFWQLFPGRPRPSPALPALVKRGRLGRKTQRGVYDYLGSHPQGSEPASQLRFIRQLKSERNAGLSDEVAEICRQYAVDRPRQVSPSEIQRELWTALLNEALSVCEDRYVKDPREVDAAWLFGLGISDKLGGPFQWAARSGNLTEFQPSSSVVGGDPREWKARLADWSNKRMRLAEEEVT